MGAFEPLTNLLMLLSVLSVAAERLANLLKLMHPDLREPKRRVSRAAEKERERRIGNRVLIVSLLLATAVKADFFAIVSHLGAPWDTLGWTQDALAPPSRLLSTLAGTALTGISLGFGSKFWHDLLDVVYGLRQAISAEATGLGRSTTAWAKAPDLPPRSRRRHSSGPPPSRAQEHLT